MAHLPRIGAYEPPELPEDEFTSPAAFRAVCALLAAFWIGVAAGVWLL